MDVFITLGQTVLDGSALEKAILISMYAFEDHLLKSISKELGQKFEAGICEGYGFVVRNCFSPQLLRYQGD